MVNISKRDPNTPFICNQPLKIRNLFIAGTSNTPIILFDTQKEYLMMKGVSSPINAIAFYNVIFEHLHRYQLYGSAHLKVYYNFDYINTSSSRCIFDITRILEQMKRDGVHVSVNWCYERDDIDMLESGEDIGFLSSIPFNFISL